MNSNPKKTNTVAVAASQEDSYEPRHSPHQDQVGQISLRCLHKESLDP